MSLFRLIIIYSTALNLLLLIKFCPALNENEEKIELYKFISKTRKYLRMAKHNSSSSSPALKFSGMNKFRIVGGKLAKENEFPFIVALNITYNSTFTFPYCSGTILDTKRVLTAAHCYPINYKSGAFLKIVIKIIAGVNDINALNDKHIQIRKINSVKLHEFNEATGENDIMILWMKVPFVFNKYVQPVKLPKKDLEYYGKTTAIGWGYTDAVEDSPMSSLLRKVTVNVIENKKCENTYSMQKNKLDNGQQISILNTMICSFKKDGRGDSCYGDSGGPLIVWENKTESYIQIGIISFGLSLDCGDPNYPSVNTRISKYIDWIDKNSIEPTEENKRNSNESSNVHYNFGENLKLKQNSFYFVMINFFISFIFKVVCV